MTVDYGKGHVTTPQPTLKPAPANEVILFGWQRDRFWDYCHPSELAALAAVQMGSPLHQFNSQGVVKC